MSTTAHPVHSDDADIRASETWDPSSVTSSTEAGPLTTSSANNELIADENYASFLLQLRQEGELLRTDKDQPDLSSVKRPSWFDESLFKNAQSVYRRHFMGLNFAHLSGLLLLIRVDSIYRTLSSTGSSDSVAKLFRRYYHTLRHVKTWYEGDIFEDNSDAYRSLLIVRGMHNKVSSKLNGGASPEEIDPQRAEEPVKEANNNNEQVHISHFDIMMTQFAFVGLIVTKSKQVGLISDFNRRDMESLLHFWRVIGYYLGASDRFNLCSYQLRDIVGLCGAIIDIEYRASIKRNPIDQPAGVMSVNIVRALKFIPMLTVYGIMRYLYELLGHGIEEIESKRNWYSKLSYRLIKLVMSNFLGYRPLRSFNNGLTRLSVYLVGKVEDWFAGLLERGYGQELRL